MPDGPMTPAKKYSGFSSIYSPTSTGYFLVTSGTDVTISPAGELFVNTTGNPGMATGGSGDVLTGIILALLAQGYDHDHAALMAVYIHGLAGDMAASQFSMTAMTSADIAGCLPQVWLQLEKTI